MKKLLNQTWILLLGLFLFLSSSQLFAQVTTATLSGFVKDSKGVGIGSATVTVEYPDAGIKHVLTTNSDGRFTLPNLRVGGPYKVTVDHVGYHSSGNDDLFLELGLNNTIEVSLVEKSTELSGVTVTATGAKIFDNKRTGASTNISRSLIRD